MKKLLFVAAMLFSSTLFGQSPEPSRHFVYCELIGPNSSFSNKVTVDIDFGQESGMWDLNYPLRDSTGKEIEFNSMVDAMNYMDADGWEFVQSYSTSTTVNNILTYHWLLKKDVKNLTKEQQASVTTKFKKKKR